MLIIIFSNNRKVHGRTHRPPYPHEPASDETFGKTVEFSTYPKLFIIGYSKFSILNYTCAPYSACHTVIGFRRGQ